MHLRIHFSAILCAVAVALSLHAAQPQPAGLGITAAGRTITVSNATARGPVFIAGYMRIPDRWAAVDSRHQAALTAGSDGAVSLELTTDIAEQSMFVAIDVTTGAYAAVAGSPRFPLRALTLPDGDIKTDKNGDIKKIELHLPYAYVVVVQAGVGAWEVTTGDGGTSDGDQKLDGKIDLDVEAMKPLGSAATPPKKLKKGDLVLVLDPQQMAFFAGRVK